MLLHSLPLVLFAFQGDPALREHLVPTKEDMVLVRGGRFQPTLPRDASSEVVDVESFWLDRDVVDNGAFLAFVVRHPQWQRGRVSPLFAEPGYLEHWSGPTHLGPGAPRRKPVVQVSWFAAKAYCEARGARLPRESEWEYAAAASETLRDARQLPEWRRTILDWYARPAGELADVGSGAANYWGVRDLHGLVWEWVLDFNSMLVSGDSRAGAGDLQSFCGAGALTARDRDDYAAFMRVAFLSSLKASYVGSSLGFRCARSSERSPS